MYFGSNVAKPNLSYVEVLTIVEEPSKPKKLQFRLLAFFFAIPLTSPKKLLILVPCQDGHPLDNDEVDEEERAEYALLSNAVKTDRYQLGHLSRWNSLTENEY
jgi:hypothetical protein